MVSILYWINVYAAMYNMNPMLVRAIVQEESNYNSNAVGKLYERGLMQIRPEYTTCDKSKLFEPQYNIKCGIAYLAEIRKECQPKLGDAWIICYNLGPAKAMKIKYPKQFVYYKNIMRNM